MPKTKMFISLIVIVLAVALVGGATMAWFTAITDPIENVFEAGTVVIQANRESHTTKSIADNWNPGDRTNLKICVENEGSKAINLRAKFQGGWLPSALRLLIIYKDQDIQLLALEWDSTCKGCTGTEGPIATASEYSYSVPGTKSYMAGTFTSLSDQQWLSIDDNPFAVWCVDSQTNISGTQEDVLIFDPFCNENWYEGLNVQERWKNIPWGKMLYIINTYKVNDKIEYLDGDDEPIEDTIRVMDIQQAMWKIINGNYHTTGHTIHSQFTEAIADIIVSDTEANWELDDSNVIFDLGPDWQYIDDTGDIDLDGWWYYKGTINDGSENFRAVIPGSFTHSDIDHRKVCLDLEFYLSGRDTGNQYQGAQYWFTAYFDAIQASNNASNSAWKMNWNSTNNQWERILP